MVASLQFKTYLKAPEAAFGEVEIGPTHRAVLSVK